MQPWDAYLHDRETISTLPFSGCKAGGNCRYLPVWLEQVGQQTNPKLFILPAMTDVGTISHSEPWPGTTRPSHLEAHSTLKTYRQM